MGEMLYKVARATEWDAARGAGVFTGSADDERDGFIHLSRGTQLRATLEKHFAGEEGLLLVTLDAGGLGPALKWEPSRGGETFPHLYGPLQLTSVRSVVAIRRDGDGRPILPSDISTPEDSMTTYKGSCHCGAVEFEIESDLTSGLICDCSLCKRKNAIMFRLPKEQFRLLKGEGDLTTYQWNTRIAKHYFCKHCGIYTHHQPRTVPDMMGVNLGCIDTIDARTLPIQKGEGSKLSGGR